MAATSRAVRGGLSLVFGVKNSGHLPTQPGESAQSFLSQLSRSVQRNRPTTVSQPLFPSWFSVSLFYQFDSAGLGDPGLGVVNEVLSGDGIVQLAEIALDQVKVFMQDDR